MRRSNQGYADEAPLLLRRYESVSFAEVHRAVAHLFPTAPAGVLDIGAGTGRDAAGFAALGHRMFAVSADETIALAVTRGLRLILNQPTPSVSQGPEVSWVRLGFEKD